MSLTCSNCILLSLALEIFQIQRTYPGNTKKKLMFIVYRTDDVTLYNIINAP